MKFNFQHSVLIQRLISLENQDKLDSSKEENKFESFDSEIKSKSSSFLEDTVSYNSIERRPTWAIRARQQQERRDKEKEEQERRDLEYARRLQNEIGS